MDAPDNVKNAEVAGNQVVKDYDDAITGKYHELGAIQNEKKQIMDQPFTTIIGEPDEIPKHERGLDAQRDRRGDEAGGKTPHSGADTGVEDIEEELSDREWRAKAKEKIIEDEIGDLVDHGNRWANDRRSRNVRLRRCYSGYRGISGPYHESCRFHSTFWSYPTETEKTV